MLKNNTNGAQIAPINIDPTINQETAPVTSTPIPQGVMAKPEKLFKAESVVPVYEYRGIEYQDFRIMWFVCIRPQGRRTDFAGYIDPSLYETEGDALQFPEDLVDECFTVDEITAFANWLPLNMGWEVTAEEQKLPIRDIIFGCRIAGTGCGHENIDLSLHPDYDLPFQVYGYFDAWDILDGEVYLHFDGQNFVDAPKRSELDLSSDES